MIEANRYKLGIFIAVALTLIITSFFLVGLSKIFEPKIEIVTVFKDSVEGLKIGSSVKYKGVPLGNVTRIAMRNTDEYIDVYMVVYSSSMDTLSKENGEIMESSLSSLHDYFLRLKKKGITCSLQSAGITGGAYLELDQPAGNDYSPLMLNIKPPDGMLYIPSRPSHITAVIENLSKTAEELAKVDFIKFAGQLRRTLDTIDARLNDNRIDRFFSRVDEISAKIDSLLQGIDKTKLDEIYKGFKKCIDSVNSLAIRTDKSRGELIFEAKKLRARLIITLSKFNDTLSAIKELARDLDDDPSSILKGKSKPEMINK